MKGPWQEEVFYSIIKKIEYAIHVKKDGYNIPKIHKMISTSLFYSNSYQSISETNLSH